MLERLPASVATDCTVTEVAAAASYATTPELLARIAAAAREALADPTVDGVVVTHGTDTVEEAVWLTHLFTAGRGAPVVFTCAMRHAGELGEDGPRNLADAVAVARDSRARGRGALLCVNGEVHAARWVRKWHATALAAFRSPGHGPVGEVVESEVRFHCGPAREAIAPLAADADTLVPDVAVVPAHGGLPPEVVDLLVDRGAAGLVLEGTGGGNVHPRFRPAVCARWARDCGRGDHPVPHRGTITRYAAMARPVTSLRTARCYAVTCPPGRRGWR